MGTAGRINRRAALGVIAAGAATLALPGCGAPATRSGPAGESSSPSVRPGPAPQPVRIPYGDDGSQWGELHLPAGARRPGTVVIVHGGFWLSSYGAELGTPLAADLARRGWCVWNLEYRRVGNGGGWPATLQDVAAGTDQLAAIAAGGEHGPLDLGRVVAIGHSAGGQLAAWLAGRPGLGAGDPGAARNAGGPRESAVAVTAVVSQAGVLDLAGAAADRVGGTAVPDLLGGTPAERPDRYRVADPTRQLPLGVPVHCVHSKADGNVPYVQSADYVAAARRAGDTAADLHTVDGDHFTLIDPTSAAWAVVVGLLPQLLDGSGSPATDPAATNPPAPSSRTTDDTGR